MSIAAAATAALPSTATDSMINMNDLKYCQVRKSVLKITNNIKNASSATGLNICSGEHNGWELAHPYTYFTSISQDMKRIQLICFE